VAVAVARDLSRAGHRKIAGALAGDSGGACAVTHPQAWGRVTPLRPGGVAAHVRMRGTRVVRAGDARIMFVLNRHGTSAVTARRDGPEMVMVVHGADPAGLGHGRAAARRAGRGGMLVARTAGRMAQAGAIVSGGKALAAREADEHRRTGHEGGIRRRKGHRAFVAVAPGPGSLVRAVATATAHGHAGDAPSFVPLAEAAVACSAPGPGTRVLAGKAYATRETMSWCAEHGARGRPCRSSRRNPRPGRFGGFWPYASKAAPSHTTPSGRTPTPYERAWFLVA